MTPLNTLTDNLDIHALNSNLETHATVIDAMSFSTDGCLPNDIDPMAYTAITKNNPNSLSQKQMLSDNDRPHFVAAQKPKIDGLQNADVFEYLLLSELSTLPHGTRILNAIWSYRRKRRPDGDLHKYKSRICVDGSQQRYGIDYWDMYAPVVQWSTVRLLFILATTLGLSSRQIDYVQAFPQAALDDPVYMKVPQGWFYCPTEKKLRQFADPKHTDPSYFIKLKKNLYGCKQAAFNWYQHLV